MLVSDFVQLFGLLLLVSVAGFKWGQIERAASDYLDEVMK